MTVRVKPTFALAALAAAALGLAAFTYLHRDAGPLPFQGWVEGYFLFVSADEPGRIETLSVREGDQVAEAAPLFALDADLQRAAVAENEAAVTNAHQVFERAKTLFARNVGTRKDFDDAEAALRTAEARLSSSRTRLERRRVASPANGTIQELYFRVGETVPAGRPILSLLPPENARVRFFVPQAALPAIRIGDRILVTCDGCASGLFARINFISAQAEFTPPVIYSLEERARLVFRVEAIPERAQQLRVGQPVSVALESTTSVDHAHQ
jgi:HlyD family secretion protein